MLRTAALVIPPTPWRVGQPGETGAVGGLGEGGRHDLGFRTLEHRRATAQALVTGGDTRLQLNEEGVNAYGCQARPDHRLLAWGSSTASTVSATGFEAASRLLARLHADPDHHVEAAQSLRDRLAQLTGAARVPGCELVLAASGTDIHLIAQQLLCGGHGGPLQAVMPDPTETGSGLPAALAGHHFNRLTCAGREVPQGGPVGGRVDAAQGDDRAAQPITVALREPTGQPRPAAVIDLEVEQQVQALVARGARGLLILTDQSKTGLIAPSPDCASRLLARYPQDLTVLVDACQFRLAPDTVAAYLRRGFLVALTGSKFVTGPAFCGVLLLPPSAVKVARNAPLLALQAYSQRAHWPAHWAAARVLPSGPNIGLLLRWEAALAELTPFAQLPEAFVEDALLRWGHAVSTRLHTDPGFEALPALALDRGVAHAGWDRLPTLFPFVLRRPAPQGGWGYLTPAETQHVHRALRTHTGEASASVCELGQPVSGGVRAGRPVSALRLCASARLLVAAAQRPDGVASMIEQAMRVLDQIQLRLG